MRRAAWGVRALALLVGLGLVVGGAAFSAQDPKDDDPVMKGKSAAPSKTKAKAKVKAKGKGAPGNKASAAKAAPESKPAEGAADEKGLKFSRDIAPILVGNCTGCHNAQQRRGKFDMTSFDKLMKGSDAQKVIAPGNPEESELVLRIRNEAEGRQKMPPGQRNLAPETIAKIEEWIKSGARFDLANTSVALDTIAPKPEEIRRSALSKLSADDRDKKLEAVAQERWKKATTKSTPEMTPGKNFVLFSNLPKARAEALLKGLEAQRNRIGNLLGPKSPEVLNGPEKISVYVFNDLPAYVEFVRSVESRENEQGIEAHGKLDVEGPYLAAADPLAGRDEPSTKESRKPARSKTKKGGDLADEPTGPERTLLGLLTEQLVGSAVNAAGKPPRWLIYGLGAYLANQAEPRMQSYYRKLRASAAEQYRLGWKTKSTEALGDATDPALTRAVGFSLVEFVATAPDLHAGFSDFVRQVTEQGGPKLFEVIKMGWGIDQEPFMDTWGQWVAVRYGSRGR